MQTIIDEGRLKQVFKEAIDEILNRTFHLDAGIDPANKAYVLTLNHAF